MIPTVSMAGEVGVGETTSQGVGVGDINSLGAEGRSGREQLTGHGGIGDTKWGGMRNTKPKIRGGG